MEEKILTPIKSIRAKCLNCSCGSSNEVSLCVIEDCPLFPYRFGKNPNRKGNVKTDEQKQVAKERLLAYHAKKKASKELPE